MDICVITYILLFAKCLALPDFMQLQMDKDREDEEWNTNDSEGSESESDEVGYRMAIDDQGQSDDSNIHRIQSYEKIYYPDDRLFLYDKEETSIADGELPKVDKFQEMFIYPYDLSLPNAEDNEVLKVDDNSDEESSRISDFGIEDQINEPHLRNGAFKRIMDGKKHFKLIAIYFAEDCSDMKRFIDNWSRHNDYFTQTRNKRAAVFPAYELGTALLVKGLHVVRHLLRGTTAIDDYGKLQVFEKPGGLSQAMKDFHSVQPSGMKEIDTGAGRFVWKGMVGDRKLVLTSRNAEGQTTLEITKVKQLYTRTKGQYRDLPDQLVTEKIVYTKKYPTNIIRTD